MGVGESDGDLRKTLIDYLMKGIKGRFFIQNPYNPLSVYQVIGVDGIANTDPPQPYIRVCYLSKSFGSSKESRTENLYLGSLLEDRLATKSQVARAKRGKAITHKNPIYSRGADGGLVADLGEDGLRAVTEG